ncbi:unnamed protein product [Candidula unifasciata]|uniref:G-protein coupled receptors family 1 profile domain-containing protein n=1 Tax=Candidula unifasciata TaxID=100452 RepID=A0A8S4A5P1_9EUPU|nr:unnamed protein product [Candidula unifasciata]
MDRSASSPSPERAPEAVYNDIYIKTILKQGIIDLVLDQLTDKVHWIIVFVVTPAISLLGLVGNTFSAIVLTKHGFKKSSNVLLFSLAISDSLFIIGINGPPKPMYEFGPGGFAYPEPTARVLYYLYQLTDSINWTTGPTSLMIPVFVMVERLIAVFLPLRFHSIVTVRRTVIAVVVLFAGTIIMQIYIRTWFKFAYVFDSSRNISVGIAMRTDSYWAQRHISKGLEIFVNSVFVMIIFVGCGCIAIGVKMKMVARKRLEMTMGQKEANNSRTTKMLLCLCIFYTFACFPTLLTAVVPTFMVFPVFQDKPNFRSIGVFIYHIYKLVFCINGSCNFLIYVATNAKFRETFLNLLQCQRTNSRSGNISRM